MRRRPSARRSGPVTADLLAKSPADTSQWLTYGGGYRNLRNSPVASLTPASVKGLHVAWSAPTGTIGQFESSPVVYAGVMYVTTSYNRLMALDAKTGEFLWRYDVHLPDDLRLCCGPANRGVAIGGDYVIMATLDAHLIAFERMTGKVAWTVELADYKDGYSATSAPLIIGDLVYTGVAGGEFGARGFIDAYDLKTGKQVWRIHTVPGAGEPGADTWAGNSAKSGGAPAWTTGAYDAETDTLFWTVGNPSPDWNGDLRGGDNLYADSVLALDPKTGKMKWYFQFTPHDVWDYDGNTQLFLIDTDVDGKPVKAIAQPNRNGFFYLLDRTNGKFLRATQYVEQLNWAKGVDAKGRPIVDPAAMPQDNPTMRVCPSNLGGMNGSWSGAYDPKTGLVYAPSIEACQTYQKGLVTFVKGIPFMGGMPNTTDANEGKSYGLLSAIDVEDRPGQMALPRRQADDVGRRVDRGRRPLHRQHARRSPGLRPGDRREALVLPHGRRGARPADRLRDRRQALCRHPVRRLVDPRRLRRRGLHAARGRTPLRLLAGQMKTVCALAAAVLTLSVSRAAAAEPLRVCFDDHDAPRAEKSTGAGYDVELMGLVAARLGRPLEAVWIESDAKMTDVDDTDLPLKHLAKGECDAVASVPGEMALQGMHGVLALTRPYYGAGFELVGPERLPNDLAALKGRKVSVQNVSVANLVAVSLGLDWTAQTTAKAQLETLDSGKAEAALVWGPDLGPEGRKPKSGFTPPVVLRWDEHVATRKRDEALRGAIDGALADLGASGKVSELLAKYGVPTHEPFDKVFSPQDLAAIQAHRN